MKHVSENNIGNKVIISTIYNISDSENGKIYGIFCNGYHDIVKSHK